MKRYLRNYHHPDILNCWLNAGGRGICAVGHEWTFREWVTSHLRVSSAVREDMQGDIILAYASDNMIAYVGEAVDGELRMR